MTRGIGITATARRRLMVALLLIASGCASTSSSQLVTPSEAGSAGATVEATPTAAMQPSAPDLGAVDDALVGSWLATDGGSWTLEFNDDGTFSLLAADGQLDVTGVWGVSGDEITLQDVEWGPAGGPCGAAPTSPYHYTWRVEGERLSFVVVRDVCPDRWTIGTEAFERQP